MKDEWTGDERRRHEMLIERLIDQHARQQDELNALRLLLANLAESVKDIVEAHKAIRFIGKTFQWIAGISGAIYAIWYMLRHGGPPQ